MSRLKSISRGIFGAFESVMASNRYFDGVHPKDPKVARFFGVGTPTAAGVKVSHDSTMAIPAIYRGINIIANGLSRVPFYVFKQDEDGNHSFAKGHTSWKAISVEPNPEIKQVDFRRTMTAWAVGWGNAVAHISRPGWPNGGPVVLTPLLPDRTYPVRITANMVKNYDVDQNLLGMLYYQTRINDVEVAYPASDCLHIRGLGPNPYWGWDIVELLVQAIGGAQARAEFGHRFYGQGANPGGFINIPATSTMDEEAEKRFVESIKRGMEGMGKAHRLMVLEEGATFQQWTIDPAKAQFLEGMQFDYRVLANIIGIKVHKLIDGANSAYASLEQANSEHRDDDLFPWILQWLGEYNTKMLTERQRNEMSHVVEIDDEYIDGWVPFKERAEGVVLLKNNDLITRDEGRSRLNWGPSKDRNGNRHTIPMNIEFTDDKVKMTALEMDVLRNPPPPTRTLPAPADNPDDAPDDNNDDEGAIEAESEIKWQYDCRKGDHGAVYLNGEELKYVIACDVSNGRALVMKHDADGNKIFDGKELLTEIVQGEVLFVPRAVADAIKSTVQSTMERLTAAWLSKVKARLGKQAHKLASKKDASEFIGWVDGLTSETAPGEIQAAVDELYRDVKSRLLAIVDSPPTTGLAAAVAAEVESWSESNDTSQPA